MYIYIFLRVSVQFHITTIYSRPLIRIFNNIIISHPIFYINAIRYYVLCTSTHILHLRVLWKCENLHYFTLDVHYNNTHYKIWLLFYILFTFTLSPTSIFTMCTICHTVLPPTHDSGAIQCNVTYNLCNH